MWAVSVGEDVVPEAFTPHRLHNDLEVLHASFWAPAVAVVKTWMAFRFRGLLLRAPERDIIVVGALWSSKKGKSSGASGVPKRDIIGDPFFYGKGAETRLKKLLGKNVGAKTGQLTSVCTEARTEAL